MRQALEDRRFDVRANVYTLIAITGVILYWRGVWTLWCALGCVPRPEAPQHARHTIGDLTGVLQMHLIVK